MKIKGYVNSINVGRNMEDVYGFGGTSHVIAGPTIAKAEIIFTEGNLDGLIAMMGRGDPIEIDIDDGKGRLKGVPKEPTQWRMIRL